MTLYEQLKQDQADGTLHYKIAQLIYSQNVIREMVMYETFLAEKEKEYIRVAHHNAHLRSWEHPIKPDITAVKERVCQQFPSRIKKKKELNAPDYICFRTLETAIFHMEA